MTKFKYQVELSFRNKELFEENSSLNERNLEGGHLTQNYVTISIEKIMKAGIQFTGLEIDWMTEFNTNLPTVNADPPTADADPPNADANLLTAKYLMPFTNMFS